jgi:hypothetical protein
MDTVMNARCMVSARVNCEWSVKVHAYGTGDILENKKLKPIT